MNNKIRIYEIPSEIMKANEIEFNHENNQYKITKGFYMNIPSDAIIFKYKDSDFICIEYPFGIITLSKYDVNITLFSSKNRQFIPL